MSSSTNKFQRYFSPTLRQASGVFGARGAVRYAPHILPVGRSDRRSESGDQTSGADRWWIGWTSPQGERVCRIVNVIVATVGIILTLPFMVLIALAVKFTSRGPIIYTQHRVGTDIRMGIDRRAGRRAAAADRRGGPDRRRKDVGGRIFSIYKFRTMTVQKESRKQSWARPDDPRLTPVGSFLRRYRLDELPQFFNVLKGDMNVVGPRPEQPEIFSTLRDQVYGYAYRQRVRPGITGWAQVNLAYDQSIDDVRAKVGMDLEYIRRRSAVEDLKIMARTVPVMIGKKGSV